MEALGGAGREQHDTLNENCNISTAVVLQHIVRNRSVVQVNNNTYCLKIGM